MTDHLERYADWRAVEMAIKEAAKTVNEADSSRQIGDLIRQAHYDRFLCRVFSDGDSSEWILKGGSGMLARIPNARRTQDADLYLQGYDKDRALTDLRRLTEVDLGDFFRFVYKEHHIILTDDLQPYADGYRVTFDAYLGPKTLDPIKVDLSAHVGATVNIARTEPANRLPLPKLPSFPYRLYPIPSQIADKVCATLTMHVGRASSREKDLVDLVAIALTQTVNAVAAQTAIRSEAKLRRLTLPEKFTVPADWGRGYASLTRNTPAAGVSIHEAQALMARFIDPLLDGTVAGAAWDPNVRTWVAEEI
ncbi:MAG: nucleotidyl transferase AbiEii/AbiGii toxin family protein [Propionibacteriaceae bacterium]|nr:nucleotidyl transferase AbiEii/AbiGii toxin family protein [Propionibacteriaceae bacterium]